MSASHVPLKLRKQMLVMRAAVERVELAQHVLDVREAATISALVRNALPDRSRGLASRSLEVLRRYPFVMSAAGLLATQFKLPVLKFATKWGGMATVGYKLWEAWQKAHPESGRRIAARLPFLNSTGARTR
jgi:hypothetical protein